MAAATMFGLLLAVTNAAWRPRIIQNEIDKFNSLAGGMLTAAADFQVLDEPAEIDLAKGKTILTEIKKAIDTDGNCVGWAFVCEGAGFADKIKLVLAVDAGFEKLAGFGVLSSNETPGFGDKIKNDYFRSQFIGAPTEKLEMAKAGDDKKVDAEIVAITGATVSSDAVVTILNNYIGQVKSYLTTKGLI